MGIEVTGPWRYFDDLVHTFSIGGLEMVRDGWTNDVVEANRNIDSFLSIHGGNDMVVGLGGDDTIYDNNARNGRPVAILGSTYVPTGSGPSGNDTVFAGEGNDTIFAGDGINFYDGQVGIDTVDYSAATQAITVVATGAGQAQVFGFGTSTLDSVEWIVGSAYADNFQGDGSINQFIGGAGNDTLSGAGGGDVLFGGLDDDLLIGGVGGDDLDGDGGNDTASYTQSNAAVNIDLGANDASGGHAEGDRFKHIENVTGSNFADVIAGNDDANVLSGGGGDDELTGGLGNDTLIGSEGNDTMIGGLGVDIFKFDAHIDDADVIKDFDATLIGGHDLIDISGLGITPSNFATMVSISDLGGDTQIAIDGVGTVFLAGVTGAWANKITQSHFILA